LVLAMIRRMALVERHQTPSSRARCVELPAAGHARRRRNRGSIALRNDHCRKSKRGAGPRPTPRSVLHWCPPAGVNRQVSRDSDQMSPPPLQPPIGRPPRTLLLIFIVVLLCMLG